MSNYKGFTLIELMVVMTIVALLVGLVGPFSVEQLGKAQAKAERLNLEKELLAVSQRAFLSDQNLKVKVNGKLLSVFSTSTIEPKKIYEKTYDYIFFQPQEVTFLSSGFVVTKTLQGVYKNQPLRIDLNALINRPYNPTGEGYEQ